MSEKEEQEAWVLPLSQFIPKGKRSMNKRCKRARELEDDDDNMTITELIKSVKMCSDDVEKNGKGERSELEVDNNVSDHEIVAKQETKQKNDENNSSNGVAEQEEEDDERVKQRNLAQDFPVLVTEGEAWVLPLTQVIPKGKRWMNKRCKRVSELEDDDNMTITELIKSVKKCNDDVEKNGKGERSGLEIDNNVSDHEIVARQETEQKNDENNFSNGVSEEERVKQRKLAQDFPVLLTEGEAWVLPLSQVIPKAKRSMNKRCKRAREVEDDDNMTITELSKSVKKCSDDVEKNIKGERSGLEIDNNVSDHEIVAKQETKQKNDENNSSNGVSEQEEEDDERVKQRKLAQDFSVLVTEGEAWVLPLSQVIPKGKRWMNKGCKRVRENDENGESKDDVGNMTIAEILEYTKNCSDDVEKNDEGERCGLEVDNNVSDNAKGERSRLEMDNNVSDSAKGERSGLEVVNNVSDLPQKLAFGDEAVATQEIEQEHDENKTSKPSKEIAEQQEDDVVGDETVATQVKEQKNDENNTSNGVAEQQEDDVVVVDETVAGQETVQKNDENNICNEVAEQQEDDVGIDERLKQRKLAIRELELKMEARILKVENTLAKIKQWKLVKN